MKTETDKNILGLTLVEDRVWCEILDLSFWYSTPDQNVFGRKSSPPHFHMTSITYFSLTHMDSALSDLQQSISHLFSTIPLEFQIKIWTYGCTVMCRRYYPLNCLSTVLQGLEHLDSTHCKTHTVHLTSLKLLTVCEIGFNHLMTWTSFVKWPW